MGYIREPKDVDLVVAPSVLTEETKNKIEQAIAQYKKSGQKPISVEFVTQGSIKMSTHIGRTKSAVTQPDDGTRRKARI
jgi:hypothetical protein